MLTIYGIKSADGGFGMFQRSVEGVSVDFDTPDEYAHHVTTENGWYSYAVDADIAEMGDEDGERLSAGIRARNGATYDQNGGTIIGFMLPDGTEVYELAVECGDDK